MLELDSNAHSVFLLHYHLVLVEDRSGGVKVIGGGSNLRDISRMFDGAAFTFIDLSDFDISNVGTMEDTFRCCNNLKGMNFPRTDTYSVLYRLICF